MHNLNDLITSCQAFSPPVSNVSREVTDERAEVSASIYLFQWNRPARWNIHLQRLTFMLKCRRRNTWHFRWHRWCNMRCWTGKTWTNFRIFTPSQIIINYIKSFFFVNDQIKLLDSQEKIIYSREKYKPQDHWYTDWKRSMKQP